MSCDNIMGEGYKFQKSWILDILVSKLALCLQNINIFQFNCL